MSPRRNWDSPTPSLASECAPPPGSRGGHARLRVGGWGSPNSDDWRKSLALCLLCGGSNLFRRARSFHETKSIPKIKFRIFIAVTHLVVGLVPCPDPVEFLLCIYRYGSLCKTVYVVLEYSHFAGFSESVCTSRVGSGSFSKKYLIACRSSAVPDPCFTRDQGWKKSRSGIQDSELSSEN